MSEVTEIDGSRIVSTWLTRVESHDLDAGVALYAPDAIFVYHVPGQDGEYIGKPDIAEALYRFFIQDREEFAISESARVNHDANAAIRFTLRWLDARDGALCTCFQSHHFHIVGGLIARQDMYCAGIRAVLPE